MFVTIAYLGETLAAVEGTGERALLTVRTDMVVELAETRYDSVT